MTFEAPGVDLLGVLLFPSVFRPFVPDQSPGSFRISVILSNNCRITLRPPMAIESYFLNSDPDDPNQKICRLGNDFQLFSTSLAPGTEAIAHRPAIMFDNWQDSKYKTPHCMRVARIKLKKPPIEGGGNMNIDKRCDGAVSTLESEITGGAVEKWFASEDTRPGFVT